ncbi:DUF1574 domain-containing protein [Gemmata sp. JC673]|uniref:DUF1574 domain-containing protein n=1 Tax=Gemmata algarum TaxID=2975278 RepID=A0ABU5ES32_9BACT|nr:hypothetical protein [Gemmata algarum]MDY3558153.1 DUF1574 domain-containing protein [Gemmata algarum]
MSAEPCETDPTAAPGRRPQIGAAVRWTGLRPRAVRLRLVGLVRAPRSRTVRAPQARRARAAVLWFALAVLVTNGAALAALDAPWPNLRDPEYGWRVRRLHARAAEHPGRPLVLVVGSSRTGMGVRPSAWEAARPGTGDDPLIFNFGAVGAGPIQQLIAVRRLYADGLRPDVVLLEYWPPLLRQDGQFAEQHRSWTRLRFDDWPVMQDYFPEPEQTRRLMMSSRLNPIAGNHARWAALALPRHLLANRHADVAWRDLDRWGWLPGPDVRPDDSKTREGFLKHHREDYRRHFDGHTIHPASDRALREAVGLARAHGARVGLLFLPEASEFRNWYPPEVERSGREHLVTLARELDTPVIDAREWMGDELIADGHHLSRVGAAAFTERLGPVVARAFPAPGGAP